MISLHIRSLRKLLNQSTQLLNYLSEVPRLKEGRTPSTSWEIQVFPLTKIIHFSLSLQVKTQLMSASWKTRKYGASKSLTNLSQMLSRVHNWYGKLKMANSLLRSRARQCLKGVLLTISVFLQDQKRSQYPSSQHLSRAHRPLPLLKSQTFLSSTGPTPTSMSSSTSRICSRRSLRPLPTFFKGRRR